jgi:hypothetical protein
VHCSRDPRACTRERARERESAGSSAPSKRRSSCAPFEMWADCPSRGQFTITFRLQQLRSGCSSAAPGRSPPLHLVAGNRGRHGRTRGLTHDGQPAGAGTRIFAGVCAKSSAHMHPMSTLRELLHALGSQRERDGGNGGGAARCPCSLCCTVPLWALPRQRNQYPPGLLKQVIGSYSCESLR